MGSEPRTNWFCRCIPRIAEHHISVERCTECDMERPPADTGVRERLAAWLKYINGLTARVSPGAPPVFHYSITSKELNDLGALLAEHARLTREVEALRADGARLDFLEKTLGNMVERDAYGEPELVAHTWLVDGVSLAAQASSLRVAIDNEMAAMTPPSPEPPHDDVQ